MLSLLESSYIVCLQNWKKKKSKKIESQTVTLWFNAIMRLSVKESFQKYALSSNTKLWLNWIFPGLEIEMMKSLIFPGFLWLNFMLGIQTWIRWNKAEWEGNDICRRGRSRHFLLKEQNKMFRQWPTWF